MSLQIVLSCPRTPAASPAAAESRATAQPPVCVCSTGAAEALPGLVAQMAEYALHDGSADCRHYSYRVRREAGMEHHVLCRSVTAGEKEARRIVHALVLSQEEVAALRANAARPTPAGLVLALETKRFWRSELPAAATELDAEPTMTASALPDASAQTLWQRYTGHKGNARALFTPPYDRECLLVCPRGMRQEDLLGLVHESDWLTADRGWGRTFETSGTNRTLPDDTRRIAMAETYPRRDVPAWAGIPVLGIGPDLVLGAPAQDLAPEKAEPPAAYTPAPYSVPYSYHEADDNEAYPYTRPPLTRFQRLLVAIGGLLLLSFCINLLVYGKVDDAGALAGKAITPGELSDAETARQPEAATAPPSPAPADTTATGTTDPLTPAQPAPASPPAAPPAPAETAPVAPPPPAEPEPAPPAAAPRTDVLQWCLAGQELPKEAQEALSRSSANATVYLLGARAEAFHGALIPDKAPHGYRLHGQHQGLDVRIERDGAVLRGVSHGGEAAAVLLRLPQTRLLLLPRLRYRFGEMVNRPWLPEIRFNIKPSQLHATSDGLRCGKLPAIGEGKLIHTAHKISIVLPILKNIRHSLSFEYDEEKLPLRVKPDSFSIKKGCCQLPVKLMLANPRPAEIHSRLRETAQAEIPTRHGGCTCNALFLLADKLASGRLDEAERQAYACWRQEAGDLLPGLPDADDPRSGGDDAVAKQIRLAVCAYLNDDLNRYCHRKKELLDSFDKRMELRLENLSIDAEGELCWIFVLQEETADTHEP